MCHLHLTATEFRGLSGRPGQALLLEEEAGQDTSVPVQRLARSGPLETLWGPRAPVTLTGRLGLCSRARQLLSTRPSRPQ